MRIYIGADHRGFELKNELVDFLRASKHEIIDQGNTVYDKDDDYPIFAIAVARAVAGDLSARGIIVCGSGVGVDIVANKIDGIRSGLCETLEQAIAARRDDDINVLALAADFIDEASAKKIVTAYVDTTFEDASRHVRRLNEISELE
ncbi:MAG: RpiB/LacA/LacB family sugar-phosphate isomerase [Candidatus Paceibacterota bacterium]|jgi:ribose 5-phosphate isomerase B